MGKYLKEMFNGLESDNQSLGLIMGEFLPENFPFLFFFFTVFSFSLSTKGLLYMISTFLD